MSTTETKVKHSPAPWRWFTRTYRDAGRSLRYEQDVSGGMKFLSAADGQGFAHTTGLTPEVDLANACLMVAAPKLLAACKAAFAVESQIQPNDVTKGRHEKLILILREAIAEAEPK